jgi:mono/diheme cytochrome c family protein
MPAMLYTLSVAVFLSTTLIVAGEAPETAAVPSPGPAVVASEDSSAIDPETMRLGRTTYITCAACHGQQGEGTGAGPPLAGSEWVTGPPENLIRIQLRGLEGPITVKGREYDIPGGMAPLAYQTDAQIAAVLTYVRNSFGNSAAAVTPDQVTALRSEAGKPKLRASELIPPDRPAGTLQSGQPSKYDDLPDPGGFPTAWIVAAAIAAAIALAAILRTMRRK